MSANWRPTTAEIDLVAFRANVASFVRLVSPAMVCAVVKADGYGHGAVPCAQAAVEAGASWLGVALVEEAVELREAGVEAPILVLSEFPDAAVDAVVRYGITPTVYSAHKIRLLSGAVPKSSKLCVHMKIDTGMHRVGAQPEQTLGLARMITGDARLELGGLFTHLAVADDPTNPYSDAQLATFNETIAAVRAEGIEPGILHSANSAGTLAHPAARFDMVRVGVSLYGNDPDITLPAATYGIELKPAMTLRSAVSHVKVLRAGERISYGLRYTFQRESVVATVPIGYADGLPRRYSSVGGEVLLHGRRCPIAGRVTMDQIMVDCGAPDSSAPVSVGDEVVLIGRQNDECVNAWEMAAKLDTIAYEITCGISKRVPRNYIDTGNRS